MSIVEVTDLPDSIRSAESVELMVAGANARAYRVAPCLLAANNPTGDLLAEARLILVGAIKRWCQAGSGALQQQNAGPFSESVDTRQRAGYNLWPSEVSALAGLCGGSSHGAFGIDVVGTASTHSPTCSVVFGALVCSCGSDLNAGQGSLFGDV